MTTEAKIQIGRVVFGVTKDLKRIPGIDGLGNEMCSFTFSQVPESPAKLAKGFTPRSLKSKGLTFLSAQTISIVDRECDSVRFQQEHEGKRFTKWSVFVPDEDGTQLFIVTFAPDTPPDLENQWVKHVFQGLQIDTDTVEQLGVQLFTFEEIPPFKIADRRKHQTILTVDGVYPVRSQQDPVFSLSEVPIRLLPSQFELFVKKRLESLNVGPESIEISEIANGAFEAKARMKGVRDQGLFGRYLFTMGSVFQCECFGGEKELTEYYSGLQRIVDSVEPTLKT